jgi:hypothetical protein
LSKYNINVLSRIRRKITNSPTKPGAKSHGHICPVQKLTPLREDDGIGAKWCFILKTQGQIHKVKKNRGKTTISIENGMNAKSQWGKRCNIFYFQWTFTVSKHYRRPEKHGF